MISAVLRQLELPGDGGKVGELVAAGVDVGSETGERQLLRERHAADIVVSLEDEYLEPRLCKVAGACQPVVSRADNYGIVPRRHP